MLPVAVARSSSDGVAIRYVFPILQMTQFPCHGISGQKQARRYVKKSSPGGGTNWTLDNYSVWLSSSECGTRGDISYLRLPNLKDDKCKFKYKRWVLSCYLDWTDGKKTRSVYRNVAATNTFLSILSDHTLIILI